MQQRGSRAGQSLQHPTSEPCSFPSLSEVAVSSWSQYPEGYPSSVAWRGGDAEVAVTFPCRLHYGGTTPPSVPPPFTPRCDLCVILYRVAV